MTTYIRLTHLMELCFGRMKHLMEVIVDLLFSLMVFIYLTILMMNCIRLTQSDGTLLWTYNASTGSYDLPRIE